MGDPKASFVDAINCLTFGHADRHPVRPRFRSRRRHSSKRRSLALTGCTVGATPGATICNGGFFPNNGASNAYLSTFPNSNRSDNGIGKIDYHMNEKNTINGMLATSRYSGVGEDHPYINVNMLNTFPITVWTTTENWIYTPNSSVVNEVRFGYDRMTIAQASLDAGLAVSGGYGLNDGGWLAEYLDQGL